MYSRNVGSVHRQKESMSGPHSESEYADMAELADAHGSGPCEGYFMEVRVLLSAPDNDNPNPVPIGDGFGFLVYLEC